jgi:hypothetical protein
MDKTTEELQSLIKQIAAENDLDIDPSELATRIYQDSVNIVIPLYLYGQKDLSLIMASIHAILTELFQHDGNQLAISAGLRKLISLTCCKENKSAQNIITCFPPEE